MARTLRELLLRFPPWMLIGVIILAEALFFIAVLPPLQASLAPNYGISFTDNYQLLGNSLANGLGFRFSPDTSLTLMREPGYPLVLAALFKVFGFSLTAARMANLVFTFFSALLIARMTLQLSSNQLAARLAPLAFLAHPGILLTEARGGVECLFTLLLLGFFALLLRALETRKLGHYAVAGLVLGLSATVRSTALLFPAFLGLYFLFFDRPRAGFVTAVVRCAILVLASVLVLSPWIVRNYQLVGKFVPTASVMGTSAYAGYHICTHLTFDNTLHDVDAEAGDERGRLARSNGFRFKEMDNLYYVYFFDPQDELAFNSLLAGKVAEKYKESPSLLLTCSAKNLFNFWFAGRNWTVTWTNAAIQLPYLVLGLLGFVWGWKTQRRPLFVVFALFIVYTLCVYLPILAQARYSMHLIPILAMFGAIPVARWLGDRRDLTTLSAATSPP